MRWILLFLPCICFSQQVKLNVCIADSKEPVPFAMVKVYGSGESFITDSSGFILFDCRNRSMDTIAVYSMGYESVMDVFYYTNSPVIVGLKPKYYIQNGAEIMAFKASTILDKTFIKLQKATYVTSANAYYRQYHIENDKPVRFLEADVTIAVDGNSEKVRVNEMRRTICYEENGLQHGDHLFELLNADAARHPLGTILNARNKNSYNVNAETVEGKHVLRFEEKDKTKELVKYGTLIIEENTFHLLSYSCTELRNPNVKHEMMSGEPDQYSWDRQEGLVLINYIWEGEKIIPVSIQQDYNHKLINRTFKSVDFTVKESFNLYIYNRSVNQAGGKMELRSSLYGRPYIYHADFWKTYAHRNYFTALPDYHRFVRESSEDKEFLRAATPQY